MNINPLISFNGVFEVKISSNEFLFFISEEESNKYFSSVSNSDELYEKLAFLFLNYIHIRQNKISVKHITPVVATLNETSHVVYIRYSRFNVTQESTEKRFMNIIHNKLMKRKNLDCRNIQDNLQSVFNKYLIRGINLGSDALHSL